MPGFLYQLKSMLETSYKVGKDILEHNRPYIRVMMNVRIVWLLHHSQAWREAMRHKCKTPNINTYSSSKPRWAATTQITKYKSKLPLKLGIKC